MPQAMPGCREFDCCIRPSPSPSLSSLISLGDHLLEVPWQLAVRGLRFPPRASQIPFSCLFFQIGKGKEEGAGTKPATAAATTGQWALARGRFYKRRRPLGSLKEDRPFSCVCGCFVIIRDAQCAESRERNPTPHWENRGNGPYMSGDRGNLREELYAKAGVNWFTGCGRSEWEQPQAWCSFCVSTTATHASPRCDQSWFRSRLKSLPAWALFLSAAMPDNSSRQTW